MGLQYTDLFNQRDEAGVKEIDEETDFIIKVCEAIGMKMLITVPSFDVKINL